MSDTPPVFIGSFHTIVPPWFAGQEFALAFIERHYGEVLSPRSLKIARSIYNHPAIKKRHFALDDPEILLTETPDEKIARFTSRSIALAAEAVTGALAKAGLDPSQVDGLVVNTCSGYVCPGLSTYLMEKLGLRRTARVYDLVGSGCGGAIPNLQLCRALLSDPGAEVVLSVAVEVCSATYAMEDDLSLILSNALFGDGAAAAVLWKRPEGLELVASSSFHAPEDREAIRFVHRDGQLRNQLSLKLPGMVGRAAAKVTGELLTARGLAINDINHWALHTGGEKIIYAVGGALELSEEKLAPTRKVLSDYGNMSSPTVWFVLEEVLRRPLEEGEWIVLLTYGAGLSAHAALLRGDN